MHICMYIYIYICHPDNGPTPYKKGNWRIFHTFDVCASFGDVVWCEYMRRSLMRLDVCVL